MKHNNLGTELRKARERMRLSQQEVAQLLKTSQKTVSNIESDKSIPSLVQLVNFANIYKINIGSLIDIVYKINNNTHHQSNELKNLKNKDLELLEKIIQNQNLQISILRSNYERLINHLEKLDVIDMNKISKIK